ncbi:M23 family metallopeptidase [Achromobacter sp. GG226]|uniref:M23 family metallopeptidase n=1 Tax=Verticiella alkaliphila TaxID=2779529 RepID=UPI001C0AFD10|nr:M23 family metallopeptidase [Verticiella sp. GG226]
MPTPVPAASLSPDTAQQIQSAALSAQMEPGSVPLEPFANPVPEGFGPTEAAEAGADGNWLAQATQAWIDRTGGVPASAQAPVSVARSLPPPAEPAKADAGDGSEEARLREQIDVLARKVGEMEARLTQLDALGERLAGVAGVAPETFDFSHVPGQGGLLVEPRPMSLPELDREVNNLHQRLADRGDYLSVIDARLTSQTAVQSRTPSAMPIRGYAYNSSSYGPRVDPISGRRAFHEGLDFAAPRGTPILAAAGGVVVASHYHAGYGRMVEIDHGNKLVTRYAHASTLNVKVGDLVYRGQKIATVGSTGRSTGPHLHFEVRVAGQAADPRLFLASMPSAETLAATTP